MKLGLRVDVDTFRGTRYGVANLLSILKRHSIKASFFFSVGPDNMGRHLFRLFRPAFLKKMLRSRAASLYGWDIFFMGTLWPGPIMGEKLGHVIKRTAENGHEIGLHAWDHHGWQTRIERMSEDTIGRELERGVNQLKDLLGKPTLCSAAPSWKCNDAVLLQKEKYLFQFNSDCRGWSIFIPVVAGVPMRQPQIPTTLPTYDEVIGSHGIKEANYNEYLLDLIKPGQLNVLTVHAEVEGMFAANLFDLFLHSAASRGIKVKSLGDLIKAEKIKEYGRIVKGKTKGREGWTACQA